MDKTEEKQLKFAYWFVENKEKFKKLGLIIFAVFDLILVIFGIWGFADYFINLDKDRALFQNWTTIDYQSIRQLINPQPLQIIETTVISSGLNKYDLIAKVNNSNSLWVAPEINYRFYMDNRAYTPTQTSFILAEEEKYFMVLAYESAERIKDFSVQIDKVTWRNINKIDAKEVAIEIHNQKLESISGLSQGQSDIKRLSFEAYNNSIYNLWEVGFQIVLLGSQNKITTTYYLKINDFSSFEERLIEVNLFGAPSYPRKIIILPEVDVFNEDNFKKEEVEIEEGVR